MYKKISLVLLSSLSLYAAEAELNKKELFDYANLRINSSMSFYAGKIYMQQFNENQSYSTGFLLHDEKNASAEFGFGYMQPSTQIDAIWNSAIPKNEAQKEEGILFFMNYNF
ncbi:MAG: hypothetical protein IBX43_09960 [Campylobacterales bacterium]|nr:hypothetical protein [Campylobacterales bacterium]